MVDNRMFVSRIKTHSTGSFATGETATIRIARMRQDVGVSWYCWSLLLSCIMTIAMIIIITLQPRTEGCQIGRQQPLQECRNAGVEILNALFRDNNCHSIHKRQEPAHKICSSFICSSFNKVRPHAFLTYPLNR